jgi:L-seryl-tRNA(Ser) seleniumtransferase
LAGPPADSGPLTLDDIVRLAKPKNVPVLVDAAAELLTIPNVHLQRGATLVGYSGGKCIRGPQCAGLLLGRKDLVQAAWVESAPHHGPGRAMKVGKEEAIGMLMAVEMWLKRDHKAEYNQWLEWMNHISKRVSQIDGVHAEVREPRGLSNHTPGLSVRWDAAKLGVTGEEVSDILYNGEPRIALNGGGFGRNRAAGSETGVSITAYMMSPGEERIVADRLHAVLSNPPKKQKEPPKTPATDLTGEWDVHIQYAASTSNHRLYLKQDGNRIVGAHQGDFVTSDLAGMIDGDAVRLHSSYTEEHGDDLSYTFSGKVDGDTMSGPLSLGEYLGATWTGKKHPFGRRG